MSYGDKGAGFGVLILGIVAFVLGTVGLYWLGMSLIVAKYSQHCVGALRHHHWRQAAQHAFRSFRGGIGLTIVAMLVLAIVEFLFLFGSGGSFMPDSRLRAMVNPEYPNSATGWWWKVPVFASIGIHTVAAFIGLSMSKETALFPYSVAEELEMMSRLPRGASPAHASDLARNAVEDIKGDGFVIKR